MEHTNITLPASSATLITGRGEITAYTIGENTAAAKATVRLFDGESTGGQLLAYLNLPSGTTAIGAVGPKALVFQHGVFFQLDSGAVTGVVSVRLRASEAEWRELIEVLTGET